MITVMAALLGLPGWFLTARWLYGRWRVSGLTRADTYGGRVRCSLGTRAALAMICALFWPLVLVTALIRFRPPPTAAERAAAETALKARVAELEGELGMRDLP